MTLHQLGEALFFERELEKDVLPKLAKEAQDEELRGALEQQAEQTKRHTKSIEEAFKKLGEKPKAHSCPAFEGLKSERDEMSRRVGSELKDIFDAGAEAHTEHLEIAYYEGLTTMAKELGEQEIASLLEQNLSDERAMLKQVEQISKRLLKETAKEYAAL